MEKSIKEESNKMWLMFWEQCCIRESSAHGMLWLRAENCSCKLAGNIWLKPNGYIGYLCSIRDWACPSGVLGRTTFLPLAPFPPKTEWWQVLAYLHLHLCVCIFLGGVCVTWISSFASEANAVLPLICVAIEMEKFNISCCVLATAKKHRRESLYLFFP